MLKHHGARIEGCCTAREANGVEQPIIVTNRKFDSTKTRQVGVLSEMVPKSVVRNNVEYDGSIRYFSVRECARIQTFLDDWGIMDRSNAAIG